MNADIQLIRLASDALEVTVAPELGAKVVSLKGLKSGREWMWHPEPTLRLFRNKPGDAFENGTIVGWDECIPTVDPCRWKNRDLPDHGEIWSVPWHVESKTATTLATAVDFPVSPFRMRRSLTVRGAELTADYELTNIGREPETYIWAMHPLFGVRDGDRIELRPEARKHVQPSDWLDSMDVSAFDPAYVKTFTGPLTEGYAAIVNDRTGARLALRWDARQIGTLGLWLTRGGWHGHHHLALEPTNGPSNALNEGICRDALAPGATRRWSVTMTEESRA